MPGGSLTRLRLFKSPFRPVGVDPDRDHHSVFPAKNGVPTHPVLTIVGSVLFVVAFPAASRLVSRLVSCCCFSNPVVVRPIRHRKIYANHNSVIATPEFQAPRFMPAARRTAGSMPILRQVS